MYTSHFMPLFKWCPEYVYSYTHTCTYLYTSPNVIYLSFEFKVKSHFLCKSFCDDNYQHWSLIPCDVPTHSQSLSNLGCYFFCNTQLAPHYMLSSCSSVKKSTMASLTSKVTSLDSNNLWIYDLSVLPNLVFINIIDAISH